MQKTLNQLAAAFYDINTTALKFLSNSGDNFSSHHAMAGLKVSKGSNHGTIKHYGNRITSEVVTSSED